MPVVAKSASLPDSYSAGSTDLKTGKPSTCVLEVIRGPGYPRFCAVARYFASKYAAPALGLFIANLEEEHVGSFLNI